MLLLLQTLLKHPQPISQHNHTPGCGTGSMLILMTHTAIHPHCNFDALTVPCTWLPTA